MAIVPSFDYDLFVSYAHKNDAPWKAGQNGWVTEFILTLKAELEAQNREFRMWFDPALRTGDHVDLTIDDAISRSAVFLSVLSPAWDDSEYCRREVSRFREQGHPAFGMVVGTLSRLQGILYKDLDRERWPPEIRQTSPYRFISPQGITLNKPDEPDETNPYVIGVSKIRDSIWGVICSMRDAKARGIADHQYEVRAYDKGQAVTLLLADVPDDLYYKRDNLLKALNVPPQVEAKLLDGATIPPGALSLHMFGQHPGRPAMASDKPLSYLQLQSALDCHPVRRPLVWLARDIKPEKAETRPHQMFLESLFDESRIELLRVSFEDLKQEIAVRLPIKRDAVPGERRGDHFDPIVHVWYHGDDPAAVDPLKSYLIDKRCGISLFPYSEGAEIAIQSKLAFCDGLIVSYTEATRSWAEDLMMKTVRLRRREGRPLAFAALAMPPPSPNAFNFEHPRIVAVKATPQGRFDDVDRFLTRIEEQSV